MVQAEVFSGTKRFFAKLKALYPMSCHSDFGRQLTQVCNVSALPRARNIGV